MLCVQWKAFMLLICLLEVVLEQRELGGLCRLAPPSLIKQHDRTHLLLTFLSGALAPERQFLHAQPASSLLLSLS
jgi:hypothetical protein